MLERHRRFRVWGLDIGQTVKAMAFTYDKTGNLYLPAQRNEKFLTPRTARNSAFSGALFDAVRKNTGWSHDCGEALGVSFCGPVIRRTVMVSVNRRIGAPLDLGRLPVLNDGMAHTLASRLAGSGKGHKGAYCMLTLGSGVGLGMFHWGDHGDALVPNNGEAHFSVHTEGIRRVPKCNCGRYGCFEALVNNKALVDLLEQEGVEVPGERRDNAGFFIEELTRPGMRPNFKVGRALGAWHQRLASGICNLWAMNDMGGNRLQEPPMFVLGGGLSRLVLTATLKQFCFTEFGGKPFMGKRLLIRKEKLGNAAGCIGAAAWAVAECLDMDPLNIRVLRG